MKRQCHIFETIQSRQQIEKLKNESDFVAAHASQIIVGKFTEIFAVDADFPGSRPVQTTDQV